MFGKRNRNNTTIIGRGARFFGTLELEGAAYIEGRCEGTLRAQGPLSVGSSGSVVGELMGNVVSIAGHVEGTVVAEQTLHVFKNGSVKGDAYYGRLQVDSGGVIDGQTHQGPRTVAEAVSQSVPSLEDGCVEQTGVIEAKVRPISVRPPMSDARSSIAAGRR